MWRRGGAAAAAATVMVLLTGCGSQAPAPSATPTVTVVATPSSSPATSTPAPGASATRSAGPTATTTPADDPGRPADQCTDDSIGVAITVADGGGGAGSEFFNVLFTNTGGERCVLRGTPGVSVVGDGDGRQIGPAADRVQTGVKSARLEVGETVAAPLQIVNIGTDGGPLDDCRVVAGDGYRVYPPHSKRAILVKDPDAKACADGPVSMTVSPVIPFTD